jgi:caspase domain-containing protein
MAIRIDFAASRAVLVGTSDYRRLGDSVSLPPMPAADRSLTAMRALLTGPCGWPERRIVEYRNRSNHDPVRTEIAQAVHGVSDVLLFYYVGHGQLLHGGEDLGLALADTSAMPHMRGPTSFLFHDLRQMLETSRARVKILILDCCFAGIAVKGRPLDGTYVWAACQHFQRTYYPLDGGRPTYFTGVLADVGRDGIPGKPALLTVEDVYKEVRRRLGRVRIAELDDESLRPVTTRLFDDVADDIVFMENSWRPAMPRTATDDAQRNPFSADTARRAAEDASARGTPRTFPNTGRPRPEAAAPAWPVWNPHARATSTPWQHAQRKQTAGRKKLPPKAAVAISASIVAVLLAAAAQALYHPPNSGTYLAQGTTNGQPGCNNAEAVLVSPTANFWEASGDQSISSKLKTAAGWATSPVVRSAIERLANDYENFAAAKYSTGQNVGGTSQQVNEVNQDILYDTDTLDNVCGYQP